MSNLVKEIMEHIKKTHTEEEVKTTKYTSEEIVYDATVDHFGLDELDYEILSVLLSERSVYFLLDREISTTLPTVVDTIFNSTSTEKYELILEKLIALSSKIYTYIIYSDGTTSNGTELDGITPSDFMETMRSMETGSFINGLNFEIGKEGEIKVNVHFGRTMYERFIKIQLQKVYEKEFELIDKAYHNLLFFLLKSRIGAFFSSVTILNTDWKSLIKELSLISSATSENKANIKKGLDEINKLAYLSVDYVERDETIMIEMNQITSKEMIDIVDTAEQKEIKELLPSI